MPQRESGTTRASMSHTIAFLNAPRIFATRCFAGLTMCDSIRKRSKACFIPFFDIDVELFMRTYIVGDFQQFVESALLPVSQRNDQYAQEQARVRQSIVETWYKWIQEFFCDAVGFEIGVPCFLYAFSEYIAKFQSADYSRQAPDLHGSSHPVSWLRIKLLMGRAQSKGFETQANWIGERWN